MTVYINGVAQVGGDVNVGGLYGINVETLTGDKTLTPNIDEIYQYFDGNGAHRIITLDTASAVAGDRFVIRHNGVFNDGFRLDIKQAAATLDKIWAAGIKEFIFDGTNWIAGEIGSGDPDSKRHNVILGWMALGYNGGTAIGSGADAYLEGVAVGYSARGNNRGASVGYQSASETYGVALGYEAKGNSYGAAVGYQANSGALRYSIALGYKTRCVRTGETSTNINGADTDQENNVVQGRWEGELAGGAGATEIFCAGRANERFTIRASSVLAFEMIIVARDNVGNEVARYSIKDGLIKRDGANNTVLVNATLVVDFEDDATWDCVVTADDGNEALIITVTGDGANITQWAAVMNGVETHF